MFRAALFIIAQSENGPKAPSWGMNRQAVALPYDGVVVGVGK